ncbi:MAG: sterol desaturase family protein [Bryobacteraceae bacterium]|nr:sterol desaturase family protein [Bryobacteraceae bacterium]
MQEWLNLERGLHWSVYAVAFLAIGLWETYHPLRPLIAPNAKRWAVHIAMSGIGHLLAILTPVSAAAVALLAAKHNSFGLSSQHVIPFPLQFFLTFLMLDFVRWTQHFFFHRVEWLWRIHQVHHSDPDYDLTTSLRFHPLEAFLTQSTYLVAIFLIAPPPLATLAVELVLLAQNFFGHANTSLPSGIESRLRRFLVTPDMHRIHHSIEVREQNRNFGTMFPWWDRLLGTYQETPAAGAAHMTVGLEGYSGDRCVSLLEMLILPFRKSQHASEPARALAQSSSGN